jgi:hypothetical protein
VVVVSVSCQWSVANGQWSVASGQWSVAQSAGAVDGSFAASLAVRLLPYRSGVFIVWLRLRCGSIRLSLIALESRR